MIDWKSSGKCLREMATLTAPHASQAATEFLISLWDHHRWSKCGGHLNFHFHTAKEFHSLLLLFPSGWWSSFNSAKLLRLCQTLSVRRRFQSSTHCCTCSRVSPLSLGINFQLHGNVIHSFILLYPLTRFIAINNLHMSLPFVVFVTVISRY